MWEQVTMKPIPSLAQVRLNCTSESVHQPHIAILFVYDQVRSSADFRIITSHIKTVAPRNGSASATIKRNTCFAGHRFIIVDGTPAATFNSLDTKVSRSRHNEYPANHIVSFLLRFHSRASSRFYDLADSRHHHGQRSSPQRGRPQHDRRRRLFRECQRRDRQCNGI